MRALLEPVRTGGGAVPFVYLVCDRDIQLRRVRDESRRARGSCPTRRGCSPTTGRPCSTPGSKDGHTGHQTDWASG
jgi:hypothetical protein